MKRRVFEAPAPQAARLEDGGAIYSVVFATQLGKDSPSPWLGAANEK